jgi:hypothetical protein
MSDLTTDDVIPHQYVLLDPLVVFTNVGQFRVRSHHSAEESLNRELSKKSTIHPLLESFTSCRVFNSEGNHVLLVRTTCGCRSSTCNIARRVITFVISTTVSYVVSTYSVSFVSVYSYCRLMHLLSGLKPDLSHAAVSQALELTADKSSGIFGSRDFRK